MISLTRISGLLILQTCAVAAFIETALPTVAHAGEENSLTYSRSRRSDDSKLYSIEWIVDTSDAIVTVEVGAKHVGTARLQKVYKLKHDGHPQWPFGDDDRLAAILLSYPPKDRLLLCWRFSSVNMKWTVYDYFPLKNIRGHLALDRSGQLIKTPEDLIDSVRERITSGPRVPNDCDRQAIEDGKSVYGGYYFNVDIEELNRAEFHSMLMPPQASHRDWFLKHVQSEDPDTRCRYATLLSNYRGDDQVISALRRLLNDDHIGSSPGARGKRTFLVRRVAYESLTRLGVKAPRPQLTPPPKGG